MPDKCHGITVSKARRCENRVKDGQLFCHHHRNQQKEPSPIKDHREVRRSHKAGRAAEKNKTSTETRFGKNLLAILSCGIVRSHDDDNDPADIRRSEKLPELELKPSPQDGHELVEKFHQLSLGENNQPKYFLPRPSRNLFTLLSDLPFKSQEMLRVELAKPLSESEERGFIYIYRLAAQHTQPQQGRRQLFKVGRTINVHRRMDQWANQCGRTIVLARYFPDPNIKKNSASSYHCRASHRAERLIHLELLGRFHQIYSSPHGHHHLPGLYCKKCNKHHREWFSIPANGVLMMEAIIARWVNFVGIVPA